MNLKQREKLLMLISVFCLVALAGDRLVLNPLMNLWSEKSESIHQLHQSLDEGRSLLSREENIRRMWQEMSDRSLPLEDAEAENRILNEVDGWVNESRIAINSLKPRWTQPEDEYRNLEVRALARGNLDSVIRFLYALESDPLPIKVESLEISAQDNMGNDLTLTIRFTGLMFVDEEA